MICERSRYPAASSASATFAADEAETTKYSNLVSATGGASTQSGTRREVNSGPPAQLRIVRNVAAARAVRLK